MGPDVNVPAVDSVALTERLANKRCVYRCPPVCNDPPLTEERRRGYKKTSCDCSHAFCGGRCYAGWRGKGASQPPWSARALLIGRFFRFGTLRRFGGGLCGVTEMGKLE